MVMLAMEEVLCELSDHEKRNAQGLPPGFRFHPTDEELITFYLASKVFNGSFTDVKFAEVDLNRCEPWELPEGAKMGEREWYMFSVRDRKYPTGLRTNRATGAGYWKATGKDKQVYSSGSGALLLGMKKTLVFYKGRAPRGHKTKWVMHEYRLDGHLSLSLPHSHSSTKEEWVICRIFHKSGEKRTPPLLQVQGLHHLLDHASPTTTTTKASLPPLLATPTPSCFTLELDCQSQPTMKQNDISHSHVFPPHAFHPPPFPDHHPSSDHLFFKPNNDTTNNPKVPTKTEAAFFPFHLLDDPNNLHWMDKMNPNPTATNMPLQMDAAHIALSSAPQLRDMSSSMAFNRTGLHQILDASNIGIESWPLAQHV